MVALSNKVLYVGIRIGLLTTMVDIGLQKITFVVLSLCKPINWLGNE